MALSKSFRRLSNIIHFLKLRNKPSLKEILDYLELNDFPTSKRSLERDLAILRTDLQLAVEYDRIAKGYYIDEEASLDPERLYTFLELTTAAQILDPQNKKYHRFIDFQRLDLQRNTRLIKPLLTSIEKCNKVTFDYQPFYRDHPSTRTLEPYLIKEYDQRWYLYGWSDDGQEFKSYALDRIISLSPTDDRFRPQEIDRQNVFENIVGVTLTGESTQKVILRFTKFQAHYIKTLPLHHSQKEIEANENNVTFSYSLATNHELEQKILMYGAEVEVLEPRSLRLTIQSSLKEALKQYA